MKIQFREIVTRILVVDDDNDNLDLFTNVLEHAGFKVNSYSDPVKALEEFRPNNYDLLILDYLMPSFNVLELYKRMKQIDESIKALILTATQEQILIQYNPELRDVILKVVRKPIGIPKLLDEIDSIVRLKKSKVVV
jgi:two-component system response regulator (stage 0 sporulation protein F)